MGEYDITRDIYLETLKYYEEKYPLSDKLANLYTDLGFIYLLTISITNLLIYFFQFFFFFII